MINPTFIKPIIKYINAIILLNQPIAALQTLQGKYIHIAIAEFLQVGIHFNAASIDILYPENEHTLYALRLFIPLKAGFRFITTHNLSQAIHAGLTFEGDMEVAQSLQDFINHLSIDWEELLAQKTNDVFAHTLFSFKNKTIQKMQSCKDSVLQNGVEFLQSEANILPLHWEFDEWVIDIETLRDDVERFAQHLYSFNNLSR